MLVKEKEKGDGSRFPAKSIAAVEIVTVYRVRSGRVELGVNLRVGPFQAKVPVATGSMLKALATDEWLISSEKVMERVVFRETS
jgi:hypothetical protein